LLRRENQQKFWPAAAQPMRALRFVPDFGAEVTRAGAALRRGGPRQGQRRARMTWQRMCGS